MSEHALDLGVASAPVREEAPARSRVGAALLAESRRTWRPHAVVLSVIVHFAVLAALATLRPSAPRTPPVLEQTAVLVRLPRAFSRPAPVAARSERRSSARRRPHRAVAIQPPSPIAQPTPAPVETPPVVVPEPAVLEEAPAEAPDAPAAGDAPASDAPTPGGVIGGTGAALEFGQVARPPVLLAQEKPEYPRAARFDRIEGRVLLRAVIGVDGQIEPDEIRVLHSIPALDAAAIAALRKWRFSPGRDAAGNPVRVLIEIPFEFSLR
ncbi:MAG TPA: TonB family protein [Polyangia bacterium]